MERNIYTNKHTKQTLKPRHTHKHKIHMGEHSFESKLLEHNKHTATLQTLDLSSTCVSRVGLQPDLFAMVLACKLGLGLGGGAAFVQPCSCHLGQCEVFPWEAVEAAWKN